MRIGKSAFLPLVTALLLAPVALAGERSGYTYLSYAGPDVALASRADEDTSARPNTPILAGDRLTTGPSSRAEAVLADGTVVRIDVRTNVRFDHLAATYDGEDDRDGMYLERGGISIDHGGTTTRD